MAGRPRTFTDDELLDATERVVARVGVRGVTFASVGREAGVAASSLHARFGSKRALLLAVAARATPPEPPADLPPREALLELLVRAADPIADHATFASNFGLLALDVTDPEFAVHARRWTLTFRATIERLLAEAGYRDANTRAPAVHAAQQGALLLWALDREGEAGDRIRAAVGMAL